MRRFGIFLRGLTSPESPNIGPNGKRLWLEAVLWAADSFNRSATKANTGWRSPYEVFFSRLPGLQMVPCVQENMMRVNRSSKCDEKSALCYFLTKSYNHPASAVKALEV